MDRKRIKPVNINIIPWYCKLVEWGLMRPVLYILHEFVVEGLENIPPEGPAILICKHQSWMDLFATLSGFPGHPTYLAKYELFENLLGDYKGTRKEKIGRFLAPFTAWSIKALGALPLDREKPARFLSTFKTVHRLIKEGGKIVVFPEGQVVPGRMGPFKKGFIEMMVQLQRKIKLEIPFVPVGISYLKNPPGKTRLILRAGQPVIFTPDQCPDATAILTEKVAEVTEFDRETDDTTSRE